VVVDVLVAAVSPAIGVAIAPAAVSLDIIPAPAVSADMVSVVVDSMVEVSVEVSAFFSPQAEKVNRPATNRSANTFFILINS